MTREKQIDRAMRDICIGCRNFCRCNDDVMYEGRKLSEIMKSECSMRRLAVTLYDEFYCNMAGEDK